MLRIKSLDRLLGHDRLAALSERVASRSRLQVWQRVSGRVHTLSPIEARGYLRARGIGVVRSEIAHLINQDGAAVAAHQAKIEETAMQLLIEWISAQAQQSRQQVHSRKAA